MDAITRLLSDALREVGDELLTDQAGSSHDDRLEQLECRRQLHAFLSDPSAPSYDDRRDRPALWHRLHLLAEQVEKHEQARGIQADRKTTAAKPHLRLVVDN